MPNENYDIVFPYFCIFNIGEFSKSVPKKIEENFRSKSNENVDKAIFVKNVNEPSDVEEIFRDGKFLEKLNDCAMFCFFVNAFEENSLKLMKEVVENIEKRASGKKLTHFYFKSKFVVFFISDFSLLENKEKAYETSKKLIEHMHVDSVILLDNKKSYSNIFAETVAIKTIYYVAKVFFDPPLIDLFFSDLFDMFTGIGTICYDKKIGKDCVEKIAKNIFNNKYFDLDIKKCRNFLYLIEGNESFTLGDYNQIAEKSAEVSNISENAVQLVIPHTNRNADYCAETIVVCCT